MDPFILTGCIFVGVFAGNMLTYAVMFLIAPPPPPEEFL